MANKFNDYFISKIKNIGSSFSMAKSGGDMDTLLTNQILGVFLLLLTVWAECHNNPHWDSSSSGHRSLSWAQLFLFSASRSFNSFTIFKWGGATLHNNHFRKL